MGDKKHANSYTVHTLPATSQSLIVSLGHTRTAPVPPLGSRYERRERLPGGICQWDVRVKQFQYHLGGNNHIY